MLLTERVFHAALRAIRPRVSSRDVERNVLTYLASALESRFGLAEGDFAPQRIPTGSNTCVYRWNTQSRGTVFIRAWPYDRRYRLAREHTIVSGLFKSAGLTVPEILHLDDSISTALRYGIEIVIEAQAAGKPFLLGRDPSPELIAVWAKDLARMHRNPSKVWGKPWRPDNRLAHPREFWLGRIEKFRQRITAKTSGLEEATISHGLESLEKFVRSMKWNDPVLIHADLAVGNHYADAEGRITWLDFGTGQYGLREMDLAKVEILIQGGKRFAEFYECYLRESGEKCAIDPDVMQNMGDFFHWEKLNSRIQKSNRRNRNKQSGDKKPDEDLVSVARELALRIHRE